MLLQSNFITKDCNFSEIVTHFWGYHLFSWWWYMPRLRSINGSFCPPMSDCLGFRPIAVHLRTDFLAAASNYTVQSNKEIICPENHISIRSKRPLFYFLNITDNSLLFVTSLRTKKKRNIIEKTPSGHVGTRSCVTGQSQQTFYML